MCDFNIWIVGDISRALRDFDNASSHRPSDSKAPARMSRSSMHSGFLQAASRRYSTTTRESPKLISSRAKVIQFPGRSGNCVAALRAKSAAARIIFGLSSAAHCIENSVLNCQLAASNFTPIMLRECTVSGAAKTSTQSSRSPLAPPGWRCARHRRDAMWRIRAHSASNLPCHARHALERAESTQIFH